MERCTPQNLQSLKDEIQTAERKIRQRVSCTDVRPKVTQSARKPDLSRLKQSLFSTPTVAHLELNPPHTHNIDVVSSTARNNSTQVSLSALRRDPVLVNQTQEMVDVYGPLTQIQTRKNREVRRLSLNVNLSQVWI